MEKWSKVNIIIFYFKLLIMFIKKEKEKENNIGKIHLYMRGNKLFIIYLLNLQFHHLL